MFGPQTHILIWTGRMYQIIRCWTTVRSDVLATNPSIRNSTLEEQSIIEEHIGVTTTTTTTPVSRVLWDSAPKELEEV